MTPAVPQPQMSQGPLGPLTQAQQDQLRNDQQALQMQLGMRPSSGSSTTISMPTVVPVPVRTGAPGIAPSQIVLGKVLPLGSGTNSKSGPGARRQAPIGANRHFCIKFLSGMCFEQGCSMRHATSADELAEGRAKFDRACVFGRKCFRMGCLYRHDI